MNALPIIGAGASFAGAVILGLVAGIWLAGRTGQQLWVFGGLLVGMIVGGYGAYRLAAGSSRK
ncbi:MAG: AtpZ/AtpI family protein [Candidatus Eremiobacteraeota bacterium]|nr:AtpZ/AtpI family protein [Candidatus Eremiobacteraeota bacterium]